jgi:hypothetical protein
VCRVLRLLRLLLLASSAAAATTTTAKVCQALWRPIQHHR